MKISRRMRLNSSHHKERKYVTIGWGVGRTGWGSRSKCYKIRLSWWLNNHKCDKIHWIKKKRKYITVWWWMFTSYYQHFVIYTYIEPLGSWDESNIIHQLYPDFKRIWMWYLHKYIDVYAYLYVHMLRYIARASLKFLYFSSLVKY